MFINGNKGKFTIVPNEIFKKGLSLKAIGLYVYLNSKPEDWNFTYKGISSQLKEGEKAIRGAVKELVKAKMLIRIPKKGDNGEFNGWIWVINPTKEHLKHIDPSMKASDGTCHYGHDQNGNDRNGHDQNGKFLSNTIEVNTIEVNNKRESIDTYTSKDTNYRERKFFDEKKQKIYEDTLSHFKFSEIKQLGGDERFIEELIRYRDEIGKPFKSVRGVVGVLNDIINCYKTHKMSIQEIFELMSSNEWKTIKPTYSCFEKPKQLKGKVNPIEQGKQMLEKWYANKGGNNE